MAGILVYALHDDEGNFNKNSLGAISEAAKLAGELGGEAAALVVGDVADDACAALGNYGATKVYRAKERARGPGPADRRRDGQGDHRRTASPTRCSAAACSASRSAPASPPASTPA